MALAALITAAASLLVVLGLGAYLLRRLRQAEIQSIVARAETRMLAEEMRNYFQAIDPVDSPRQEVVRHKMAILGHIADIAFETNRSFNAKRPGA